MNSKHVQDLKNVLGMIFNLGFDTAEKLKYLIFSSEYIYIQAS